MKKFSEFVDWAVIAFLAFVVLSNAGCGDSKPQDDPSPSASPTFTGNPLSDDDKMEVSRQIFETNSIAPQYGVANPKPPSFYIVEVQPTRPEICDDPHAMAKATSDLFYDQTESDKNPLVGHVLLCFSGRFVAPNKIIITREALVDRIVRFESEHLVLYHGNRQLFEETKYHPADKPHPILR